MDLGTFSSDLTIDLPIQIGSNCPESDTYVDKPFSDEPIILAGLLPRKYFSDIRTQVKYFSYLYIE